MQQERMDEIIGCWETIPIQPIVPYCAIRIAISGSLWRRSY